MVYPRRGGFVITAKQDLYIPSREAKADGSGAEEKRRVRERKRAGPEGGRGRCRTEQERMKRAKRERAAKVSLILISISQCDVYLTTTAWSRERASVVFLSLHPRGAHSGWNSSRDVLFRDTAGRNEPLPFHPPFKRAGSSSRYRNLHTIHATIRLEKEKGGHPPSAPIQRLDPYPSRYNAGPFVNPVISWTRAAPITVMVKITVFWGTPV